MKRVRATDADDRLSKASEAVDRMYWISDARKFDGTKREARKAAMLMDEPWDIVIANRIPILVVAPPPSCDAILHQLQPMLPVSLVDIDCASGVSLPRFAAGTVLLRNVDACESAAQRELLGWLYFKSCGAQIISTSSQLLMPLVAKGAFLDTLYYRLNTVYVD